MIVLLTISSMNAYSGFHPYITLWRLKPDAYIQANYLITTDKVTQENIDNL